MGRVVMSLVLALAALPAWSNPPQIVWVIDPGRQLAFLKPTVSEAELVRMFGSYNVEPADITLDDQTVVRGTRLFPRDPNKRIDLVWQDEEARSDVRLAIVRSEQSYWQLPGVRLGTPLKKLQELNGQPLQIAPLEQDKAATVLDWRHGQLGWLAGRAEVRLNDYNLARLGDADRQALTGAAALNSGQRALQRLNPRVGELRVFFTPSPIKPVKTSP